MGFFSTLFALTALAAAPDAGTPAAPSARVALEDPGGVLSFAGQPHSAGGQLEMEVRDLVSAPQALSGDAGRMHLRIETDYNVVEIDLAQPGFAGGTSKGPAEPIAGGVKLGCAGDGALGSVELWGLGVVRLNGAVATSAARVMARADAENGTGLRVVVVGLPGRIFPGGSIEARFAHVEILGGEGAGGGVAAEEAPTRIQTPWGQAWVEPETPEEGAAPPRQLGDGGHTL